MPFRQGDLNPQEDEVQGFSQEKETTDQMYDWWESLSDDQRQWVEDGGKTMESAFKDASIRIAQAQANVKLLESDPFILRKFPFNESWSEQSRWLSKQDNLKFYKELLENKGLDKPFKPQTQTKTQPKRESE